MVSVSVSLGEFLAVCRLGFRVYAAEEHPKPALKPYKPLTLNPKP